MSWLFSQALVAEYSAASCSDGEPSAQLNVMPTQHKFWRNDKTMEFSNLSRFGLTCAVLTDDRGTALLTWYQEGFPVRTFQPPAKVQGSQGNAVECGEKWRGSFAKYDRNLSSWKTAQCLLLGGLESFLETWPRWGLMRNGECWEVKVFKPRTQEKEYGFLPTPKKSDAFQARMKLGNFQRSEGKKHNFSLSNCDEYFSNLYQKRFTPTASEMMMLWPHGWTDLQPVGTDKFQSWLQQHSESLLNEAA